jgi:hypothetical protein
MVISPSQTVIARYFFNGDHPILGFLYVYPSGVMRFQTTKKTTIVILSYIVFNVKVVGSNSVSMFKTSCADPRFWGGSCIESRRFWPWPGGENEDFYGGLDTSIVFQNIVIDLQRGDEIYGCLRWIVAWAPSFTTGWSAIPLVEKWADQKRLKQPSLLGVHGPHPDVLVFHRNFRRSRSLRGHFRPRTTEFQGGWGPCGQGFATPWYCR